MGRLRTCGFELGSVADGVENGLIGTGITLESTIVRSGLYAAKLSGLVSATRGYVEQQFAAAADNGPHYHRGYLRPAVFPTAENTIFALVSAGALIVRITLDSSGLLRLYDEDGLIGSPSAALTLDSWAHRIEVAFDATPAAGSDVVRAYLNGAEFAGSATRSLSVGTHTAFWGGNLNLEAQTQGTWYFDDLAINDGTGTVQNGLPGDGKVVHLNAAGAGDAAATTGTFADIDEVPPNDVTDYIVMGSIIPANYTYQSAASAGIGASDTITLVHVGTRQRAASAAAAAWTPQLKSQSAGTTLDGASVSQNDTTWRTNGDNMPRENFKVTSYVDPQAGGPWTAALLTTAVAGINVTDATPNLHFTKLWLAVEYIPSPVPVPLGGLPPLSLIEI